MLKRQFLLKGYLSKIVFILLFAAIFVLLFNNYQETKFVQDDAFTSFTYAENLLNGNGLVFNDLEKTEGYTNFLWILLLASAKYFGFNIITASQFFSMLFGFLTLIAAYLISKLILHEILNERISSHGINLLSLFIPFLMIFNGSFVYWTVSGMETSLFVFLISIMAYFSIKSKPLKVNYGLVIISVIATLTRPEGFYYFIVLIFSNLIFNFISQKKICIKKNLLEILLFSFPILIYSVWKLYYYGNLLPNTFYAKTGFSYFYIQRGINYIIFFAQNYLLNGFLVVPILFIITKIKHKSIFYSVSLIVSTIIYILIVGGDVLPLSRFFLPVLPVIYSLIFAGILAWGLKNNLKFYIWQSSLLIITVTLFQLWNYSENRQSVQEWRSYELGLVSKMKIYGEFVNDLQFRNSKKYTVALSTIGAFSYYSKSNVIDLIGLTDSYIAHHPKEIEGIAGNISVLWKERRYNADYVLSKQPDFIIFPAGLKPSAYPEAALYARKSFHFNYYPQIFYSNSMNQMLPVYTAKPEEFLSIEDLFTPFCDERFVEDYILANNYLLKFLETRDSSYFEKLYHSTNQLNQNCMAKEELSLSIRGIANFHKGNFKLAEELFSKAIKLDSLLSYNYVYLINIKMKKEEKDSAFKLLKKLNRISPQAYAEF